MNAFKKELAGMLLEYKESDRAMEQVIHNMDEVFTNLSKQKDYKDGFSSWRKFLFLFTMSLVSQIQTEWVDNLSEEMSEYNDGVKEKTDIFILLEAALLSPFEEMLLDEVSDEYLVYYKKRKEVLLG